MSFIRTLLKTWLGPQRNTKQLSLESKQTGSCGGMSTTELKIRIELILDGVDTRQIIEPVTGIAALSHALQSEFLTQLASVAELSASHAYALLLTYAPALNAMSTSEHSYWLETIKQALSEQKFEHAEILINGYGDFVSNLDKTTVQLSEVAELLEKLISTISQDTLTIGHLDISSKQQAYTDGKQLYLPASISSFDNYADNFSLYKVITFQLLGQLQCESLLAIKPLQSGIADHGNDFLQQFSFIETVRINHYLKYTFPGVWRKIVDIHKKLAVENYPESLFEGDEKTTVFNTLAIMEQSDFASFSSDSLPYQGDFSPEKLILNQVENSENQSVLMNLMNNNIDAGEDALTEDKLADRISIKHNANAEALANLPDKHQDIWEQLNETVAQHQQEAEKRREEESNKRVYYYPEWDTSLNQYRQDWCRVEEIAISDNENATHALDKTDLRFSEYKIKKTLDMIINTQRFIRYQSDGDEIDIDAWVEAKSNKTKHADDFQNVYVRNNKNSRSVAIMFAVDISGSTAGWKNEIIQQSTWLLSRTLSKLDDQFAIYAFSGSGREQCDIYPVKEFKEKYSPTIKQRIANLSAKQYTRMGAAIRHLSKILNQAEAKTKILFVLTDGRPDDIDSYRGHYGVEDTRRAFNEAKALYLNPFVLTFDQACIDYLPHMLGKNRYRLISDIAMLPVQISTIYKQLTT